MNLTQFIQKTNLEHTFLLGYYGGGNYGDELLLEVLQNLLREKGVQDLSIAHQNPAKFTEFHHDLGYKRVPMHDKKALLGAMQKNKNIIIGGGGLWGVDMNLNTFLMSVFLFIARRFFGRKVYLVGVGYYNSTNRMGHIGAWFAGHAANMVLARDTETERNFRAKSARVFLDSDMAWYIKDVDLKPYQDDLKLLEKKLSVKKKTLFLTLRRSQSKHQAGDFASFSDLVEETIKNNQDKPIIVGLLETKAKSPEEYKLARAWAKKYKNVQLLDFSVNPLTLFLFFQKYAKNLVLVGPQFHIIITAHLNGVAFMPIVYDNKVRAMLERIGVPEKKHLPVRGLTAGEIQKFIDKTFGGKA